MSNCEKCHDKGTYIGLDPFEGGLMYYCDCTKGIEVREQDRIKYDNAVKNAIKQADDTCKPIDSDTDMYEVESLYDIL